MSGFFWIFGSHVRSTVAIGERLAAHTAVRRVVTAVSPGEHNISTRIPSKQNQCLLMYTLNSTSEVMPVVRMGHSWHTRAVSTRNSTGSSSSIIYDADGSLATALKAFLLPQRRNSFPYSHMRASTMTTRSALLT